MSQTTNNQKNEEAPPAYFLSLTIENFRCFKTKETLDLSDGNGKPAMWTVLLGENGTGKTTLLQSLTLLQPVIVDENDTFHPVPAPDSSIPLGAKEQINSLDIDWGNASEIGTHIEAQICVPSERERENERVFLTSNALLNPQVIGKQFSVYNKITNLYCCAYGGLRRISSEYSYSGHTSKISHIATLFIDRQTLIDPQQWLLAEDHAQRITGDNKLKIRLDRIKQALVELLPEIQELRVEVINTNPILEVKTVYGWVNIRRLSLGYQSTIAWVIDLAYRLFVRYPDSLNPLAEPAVCLVDEIDLHMHPKWQREMIETLSTVFERTQFIVTSHSPLIVQAIPNANLALLYRPKGKNYIKIDNDVDEIRKWRVDQILSSELFGRQPVHAPEIEEILAERIKLLSLSKLSTKQEKRLEAINQELDALPTAIKPDDQKAIDLIRETARLIRERQSVK
jgi:energy-coupling factor transporter ATP-binding protein EcfA2